jgi:hypothetical protein
MTRPAAEDFRVNLVNVVENGRLARSTAKLLQHLLRVPSALPGANAIRACAMKTWP